MSDASFEDLKLVTLEELQQVAIKFAQQLVAGDVVLLSGDLGTGKTTFTTSIAQALGAKEAVSSPTFTIVHEYALNGPTLKKLYHIDLYRFTQRGTVDRETQAYITSILEGVQQEGSLVVIEWSQVLPQAADRGSWHISFEYADAPDTRHISIERLSH